MRKKINVIIVHGIGKPSPGYAQKLIKGLTEKFNLALQERLRTTENQSYNIVIREIIWDDVLAVNQDKLAALLKKGFVEHRPKGFRAFASKMFSFVTAPIFRLRTDFAAESISDIIGYKNSEAYPKIQERIKKVLSSMEDSSAMPGEKQYMSIIAHSLGTVIASDFVYDQLKAHHIFHKWFLFSNFFTLGSPMALFALQYGVELFKSPVPLEYKHGQWINIFDLDDPIAYPLKNLNEAYDAAVHVDQEVNTGGFGVSHTRYFDNQDVQNIIAQKLALDCLRINGRIE